MFIFGSGVMTVTPIVSSGVATPINIGLLQEGSIDIKQGFKELYGQYKDPLAIGAGTRKWTGKAKVARISGHVLNAIYFGGTLATGYTQTAYEADTIPAVSGPYTVTVSHSGTWTFDQGVVYAATGLPLTRVASGATVGQYSVSAGVYTFAAADASLAVTIAYNYTITGAGESLLIPQSLIGPSFTFGLNFTAIDPTNASQFTGAFYNAVCTSANFLSTKLEDFVYPEFEFSLFANAAGNVGTLNFPDSF